MEAIQRSLASRTADRTVVLAIRHAATDAMHVRLSGRVRGVGLNAAGAAQAEALAHRLVGAPVVALYSSPLLRARLTARAIARRLNLPVAHDDDLTEVDFGEWTGLSFDTLSRRRDWCAYNTDRLSAEVPGGERPTAAADRITRALQRLHRAHPGRMIAIVTHAELIRYALLGARDLPLSRWSEIDVPSASITPLECDGQRIRECVHKINSFALEEVLHTART